MKFLVQYKYIIRKTGNVVFSSGINIEAKDRYEAEAKATAELRRNPRFQSTEDYYLEVRS